MRQMWVIASGEWARFFRGGATLGALSLFYLLLGGLFLAVIFQGSLEPQIDSPLKIFWELQWLPNLVWVPLLTMRILTQERKLGLLEATLATPTSAGSVVAGKFVAAYGLYLLGWLSVPIYMGGLSLMGFGELQMTHLWDAGAFVGGGVFCLASGAFFVALGILTSSVTRSAIMAATLNVCLMLLYIILPTVMESMLVKLGQFDFMQPFYHLENLSRFCGGEVSWNVVVGYCLAAIMMLAGSMLTVERGGGR